MISKKRLLAIGLGIIIIIGGLIMVKNPFTGEEKVKYKDEQDRMVEFIASNYKDIQKVEFTEIEYNNMTGTYSFYATINNKIKINFTLRGLNGDIYVNELSSRNHGHFLEKIETVDGNPDISKVKIVYLED